MSSVCVEAGGKCSCPALSALHGVVLFEGWQCSATGRWRVTFVLLPLPFLTFSQGVLQESWQTKGGKAETLLLQLPVGDLSGSFSSTMSSAVPDMAETQA